MKGNQDPPKSFSSTYLFLRSYRFLILPVIVFTLANIVFTLTAFDLSKLVAELKTLLQSGQVEYHSFVEARARLVWGTTALLFYTTLIGVTVFCVGILRHSLSRKGKLVFFWVAALLTMAVFGHLYYSSRTRNNYSYIFFFTFETLEFSGRYTAAQLESIKGIVTGINALAGVVPVLSLLTGCCILSGHGETDRSNVQALIGQMRQLKMFIGVGSTLLVAGVMHMVAWLHWPAALMGEMTIAKEVLNFSEGMGIYWGATFSLLMATFYIPAAGSISRRAEELVFENPQQARGMDPQVFLQKNGLSLAPGRQMPQLIAILAPLLVGPIGATLTNIPGRLMGG